MIETEKISAFLEELSALSVKHGIVIGGCGCCNSPYAFYKTDISPEEKYTGSYDEYGIDDINWGREESHE